MRLAAMACGPAKLSVNNAQTPSVHSVMLLQNSGRNQICDLEYVYLDILNIIHKFCLVCQAQVLHSEARKTHHAPKQEAPRRPSPLQFQNTLPVMIVLINGWQHVKKLC